MKKFSLIKANKAMLEFYFPPN